MVNRAGGIRLKRLACAESKPVPADVQLHVFKTRGFEASRKRYGIHHEDSVKQMQNAEHRARKAVCTGKGAAWPQHTKDLGKKLILSDSRRNVMKHHEAGHSTEHGVGQLNGAGVAAQNGCVAAVHSLAQVPGQWFVRFQACQTFAACAKQVRRGTIAGAQFKKVRPEFDAFKRPWQNVETKKMTPERGTAKLVMEIVHPLSPFSVAFELHERTTPAYPATSIERSTRS